MQPKKKFLTNSQVSKLKKEVNKFCKRTGRSKKSLADTLKMSPSGLGNYLSGRTKLGETTAINLCAAIGVPPTNIVGELKGSMQVHHHRFKMSAPISLKQERTVFMENPGAWELVEIDKGLHVQGLDFNIQVRANSNLMVVALPINDVQNIPANYVLYAAHEKAEFEFLTVEEYRRKPKGFKTLLVAGFSWRRS